MERNEYKPNYNNIVKKKRYKYDVKKLTLAILLTTSIGISSAYGIVASTSKVVNVIGDAIEYNNEVDSYRKIVADNTVRTSGNDGYFINVYDLACDFFRLENNCKEDVYHNLICIMNNISYNKEENLMNLLMHIDLNAMSINNSNFPSVSELYDFFEENNILNEDGSINFDAWKKYDKNTFLLKQDLLEDVSNGVKL